ncbi:PREDICTED: cyclin-D-binding Myb-like transcription factor 1 [Camelina sativa]|uniref:Cyclin-D-binding Myb-like transcription factor 1 n=1 Tax=Camelina sativa TaxID=90675 RepID=A0ABM0T8G3_CAMSA|nr:PREDICTED: cyclin-D-binding Myb-like transcription factor 1 [Camelina sativa]
MKKKKQNRETKDGREREKLGDDVVVKKKSKKQRIDSEAEDDGKMKNKEIRVDSESEDGGKKTKKKKNKKESKGDVIGNSESSKVDEGIEGDENPLDDDADMNKMDLGAQENTDNKMKRKSKKKTKLSVDSEVEDDNLNSTKQSVDSEVEDNNLNSTKKAAKRKSKEKKQTVDSEAVETDLSSSIDAKKKRKEKKKKKKKQKQSEVSEAEESNNHGKNAKKKRKRQESGESDKDVTTPSSKSSKKVKFSDQVEIFQSEDEETDEEVEVEEVKLVRGKRFTKEEDELIKKAVYEYIDNHALGDEGLKMVMDCKSHKQVKGCWKEIESALPWRPRFSVYHRAHNLFEEGSKGVWTKEDLELVKQFQAKHGNDWKTLADAMGKHRVHVKDAWRRIRLNMNKGHWSREEYQSLYDLVNKDLRMKAFQEKHSKHGMLRDNIPWMAISDVLGTRDHVTCCNKWYDQLTSPMVVNGTWANVDDYRLMEELLKLDAACIDDVDWDYLLENRDGEACRKRWNQMIRHIGIPTSKTFAEQVEILSGRYCPELAQDREDFDNRPYDPED